jgi:hypothetical protein
MSSMVRFSLRTLLATAVRKVTQMWVSATALVLAVTIAVIFGIWFDWASTTAWLLGKAAL